MTIAVFILLVCLFGLLMCSAIVATVGIDWLVKRDDKRLERVGWRTLESVNRTHPHSED